MKGSFRYNSKMVLSRIFIITQNVITITMLTASLVIVLQINHLVNAPLGMNTKNVFSVYSDNKDVARNALESLSCVEKVGIGPNLANGRSSAYFYQDENGKYIVLQVADMDSVGFEIIGFTILEDYGFSWGSAYLNEAAMRDGRYMRRWRLLKALVMCLAKNTKTLLLVSFVLAVPLSYFVMNEWLKGFSYRISLSTWIFLAAMLFSLLIAVLSVFFQTWKAANSNPVESLKKE